MAIQQHTENIHNINTLLFVHIRFNTSTKIKGEAEGTKGRSATRKETLRGYISVT